MRFCIFLPLILVGCASRSAQTFLMQAVEQQNEILLKLESQNQRLSLEIEQMKVVAAAEKGDTVAAQECVKYLFDTMSEGADIRVLVERAKINMEQARDKMRPWIIRLFDKKSPLKSPVRVSEMAPISERTPDEALCVSLKESPIFPVLESALNIRCDNHSMSGFGSPRIETCSVEMAGSFDDPIRQIAYTGNVCRIAPIDNVPTVIMQNGLPNLAPIFWDTG